MFAKVFIASVRLQMTKTNSSEDAITLKGTGTVLIQGGGAQNVSPISRHFDT